MKQLAAILLLGIFSFNIVGYRLIASFLEHTEDSKIELALDLNNYEDDELITIRQPTNLPYYQNNKNFQRINGEVEIDGIIYTYVKCRIYNDSLELLCIPNQGKMKLQAATADLSRMVADVQQPTKKKAGNSLLSLYKVSSEFVETTQQFTFCQYVEVSYQHGECHQSITSSRFRQTPEQPPDTLPVSPLV